VSNYNNFWHTHVVRLCVIERWFHFPPHLSSTTALGNHRRDRQNTNK